MCSETEPEVKAALLDLSNLECGNIIRAVHRCISHAPTEVSTQHWVKFLGEFMSSYLESGGPSLDMGSCYCVFHVSVLDWNLEVPSIVHQVLIDCGEQEWATITDLTHPTLASRPRVQTLCMELSRALRMLKYLELTDHFKRFCEQKCWPWRI